CTTLFRSDNHVCLPVRCGFSQNDTYSLSTLRVHRSILDRWLKISAYCRKYATESGLLARNRDCRKKVLPTFQDSIGHTSVPLSAGSGISRCLICSPWQQF